MSFEQRHSDVKEDPLEELRRRLEPWASAPSSRGSALVPEACIVPAKTVADAVILLEQLYEIIRVTKAAKTAGNA
jgi:hypothetical protein